jgi:hypothetical protein
MMHRPSIPISRWLLSRMDEGYVESLFHTRGEDEAVLDRQVQRVLLSLRWRADIYPYLRLFKLMWEIVRGKYWRAFKKVHSGSNQASGPGAGAGGASVTHVTVTGGAWSGPPAGASAGLVQGVSFIGPGAGLVQAVVTNPAPLPFEDAGIKAGEVAAYRCWGLDHVTGLLHSVVYTDFIWKPGEIAEGDPSSDPHAGIYAYKSILDLHHYGSPDPSHVSGTVDMWGEVYEHTRGYRAQYAAISWIDDSPHYDAAALRKLYGVTRKRKKK